jgi:hypothetical protein
MPRYRVPIDWLLLLLAGAAAWHLIQRMAGTQRNGLFTANG